MPISGLGGFEKRVYFLTPRARLKRPLIPAEAGIQPERAFTVNDADWIPASAGMTAWT
jgi:hypothetical protein